MTVNSAMDCQLLLPGLQRLHGAPLPALPALRALLGYGRSTGAAAVDADAWLCRFFGVAQQQDVPVAPFAALGDELAAHDGYWLRVQPLHLQLQRDRLLALDAAPALSMAQAAQLVAALNAHFAGDGLHFHAPNPQRWYLRLDSAPDLLTTPLAAVLGRPVNSMLPRGGDSLRWHARYNEIQMLLHAHAVNVQLEQGGALPVNSLWLWGGGVMPAELAPLPVQIWSDDVLVRGLAAAHAAAVLPLPASAQGWLPAAVPGQPLIVFGVPRSAADMLVWERDWFVPLLRSLRQGQLRSVAIHVESERGVQSFAVTRADVWKFWRRARALEDCFG